MLKNDVGSLCNVHQLHLRRNGPRVAGWQTDTVRLRKRYAPAADPSLRLVDKPHHLPAAAVGFRCAQIIQLVRNAAQQPANGFMVLPGNQALFLPEVPVADAFIVADVQKLVSGNGYKIRLYPAVHFRRVCLFRPHQITVQWPQNGAERDRHRIQAVCAGGQPVGRLKRMGKRLAGGIAIFQRNVQNPVSTAAQIPEGKGQPAAAQVFPQPHAGKLPEFPGYVALRVSQLPGQAAQR